MSFEGSTLVDWTVFAQARSDLGTNFIRILGYFREDGIKSLDALEGAVRAGSSAALVVPAHTLKGDALQFGAEPLASAAEEIEMIARTCVENRDTCEHVVAHVVALRPLFDTTIALLEREGNPLVERRSGFGKRPMPMPGPTQS